MKHTNDFLIGVKAVAGDLLHDIHMKLTQRKEIGDITSISWIKSHSGNQYNDLADKLAGESLNLPDDHFPPLAYARAINSKLYYNSTRINQNVSKFLNHRSQVTFQEDWKTKAKVFPSNIGAPYNDLQKLKSLTLQKFALKLESGASLITAN